MKYELYKAVDKIDGELSLFLLDDIGGYTVVPYSEVFIGELVREIKFGGCCDLPRNDNETPRRNDMIDPVLLCVMEGE